MAEPLKNLFSPSFIKHFTDHAEKEIKSFRTPAFTKDVLNKDWDQMELKQRIRHISNSMHQQFSGDFKKDIISLTKLGKSIHKDIKKDNNFLYFFLPDYIEQYGIGHPNESLEAMEYFTILSSCEFAIRPFIIRYPDLVMKKMLEWSKHPHDSVRRFSSEGCRPRLPWAMALPEFKKDPAPILPILENLKADASEFVRKSVANNLNDIAKDHPDLVMNIVKKWKGKSKETDWILKHGCRTLLKKGNVKALHLFGISNTITAHVQNLSLQKNSIQIGEDLLFSFDLIHHEKKQTLLRVEYIIDYMKSGGKTSKKIFKITENSFMPNKIYSFKRKQSFKNFTTRKHYIGVHNISIVVNGVQTQKISFHLK